MKRAAPWFLMLATAAVPLSAIPSLADTHEEEAAIVLVDEDGNEVLRLGETDEKSGPETVARGHYFLKVTEPGVYELGIGSPTRIGLKRVVEAAADHIEEAVEAVVTVAADEAPALLDFDLDAGDQDVRDIKIGAGEEVEVQICIYGMPEAYGANVSISYDPAVLSYVEKSFKSGGFIPGMIPLEITNEGKVDIGGANFSKTLVSGNGILGSLRFVVADGFDGQVELEIGATQFRTLTATEKVEGESYARIHVGDGGDGDTGEEEEEDHSDSDGEAETDDLAGDAAIDALKNDKACPGCDLTGAKLQRTDLAGADLSDAVLHKTNLINSDLSGANLSGADLTKAQVFQANLSGANLSGADLDGAQAMRANFKGADLTDANLDGARLKGAVFDGATWIDGRVCGANSVGRCN